MAESLPLSSGAVPIPRTRRIGREAEIDAARTLLLSSR
jgi:hypothetical protein